jgi:hypothetical protein
MFKKIKGSAVEAPGWAIVRAQQCSGVGELFLFLSRTAYAPSGYSNRVKNTAIAGLLREPWALHGRGDACPPPHPFPASAASRTPCSLGWVAPLLALRIAASLKTRGGGEALETVRKEGSNAGQKTCAATTTENAVGKVMKKEEELTKVQKKRKS